MTCRIAILGSTGSIGRQTLDVVAAQPERFEVVALAAGRNSQLLREQVARYRPRLVSLADGKVPTSIGGTEIMVGDAGLAAVATIPEAAIVVVATSGHAAIRPTLEAIRQRKIIALANKETIVCAGEIIVAAAERHGVPIRPVDSEHSAIWQCLSVPHRPDELATVTLTASGGPFRTLPATELASVTVDQALAHPTWGMGAKVTIDSATLMNKGLEVIEAHWLFGLAYNQIDVVIHPQSLVHSFVSFRDGSVLAQLATPDMRLPIQYALTYPERAPSPDLHLDLRKIGRLDFFPADTAQFPALALAREAGEAGSTYPTVLSGADEVAVERFLAGEIRFTEITPLVAEILERHRPESGPLTLDAVAAADQWARQQALRLAQGGPRRARGIA